MQYVFPKDFIFGTSTAATQIETAFEHDWQYVKSNDGYVLDRTTDHEQRLEEDANLIAALAPYYRMSLMWSKLQRQAFAELDPDTVAHYKNFIAMLQQRGVKIMLVLHHFTNPVWFSKNEGWEKKENLYQWVDFAQKVVDTFGCHVTLWNTFNEPNVYASNGWITGYFPPFKNNPAKAATVIKHMGIAHDLMYAYIKKKFPLHAVGISHNSIVFTSENLLGWFPERLSDWWFMEWVPQHFEQADFFGMSYYARVSHDPMPITYMNSPHKIKKLGKQHDDMWEYHPEGLRTCIDRYWNKYHKPIIICENGVADGNDTLRQQAIVDYARIVHQALQDGIDIKGYFWWTAWDNFEWNLGPAMKFGLYECNFETMQRTKRPSADIFKRLAHHKMIEAS
ncbi:MAG: glycoside hydrolase family 1 protein [Cyclobacteriaceae bacterium]|nr:glycoside hydrolase family 1 protein [Cyclobacteriaceae bacterium]